MPLIFLYPGVLPPRVDPEPVELIHLAPTLLEAAGVPLAYLCIYEIARPYSPELHEGVMHWLQETPDDFRQEMPATLAGEGVLTLDIWGYCQRVWSSRAD